MKAVLFSTVLFFLMAGAVLFFREPESQAQPPVKAADNLGSVWSRADSALDRVERKVERAEQSKPKEKVRIIYRTRPVGFYQPVTSAAIVTDSAVYTVPAKVYDGVAVIDGAKLQEQIAKGEDSIVSEVPVYVDTLVEEANEHISAWQRVKDFITKPFKKK